MQSFVLCPRNDQRGVIVVLALWGGVWAAQPLEAQPRDQRYRYIDDSGEVAYAGRWEDIPRPLRAAAQLVPAEPAETDESPWSAIAGLWEQPAASADSAIYRYRGEHGRDSFTNVWDEIPTEQRASASIVDVSRIGLHSEIGAALDASLERRYQRLVSSRRCGEVRAGSRLPPNLWTALWQEYGPLIVVVVVIALFVMATPFVLRHVSVPVWVRTLSMAIPVLLLVGVGSYALVRANRTYQDLVQLSRLCDRRHWQELSRSDDPLADRAKLLRELSARVD